jgi:hypothetical protein
MKRLQSRVSSGVELKAFQPEINKISELLMREERDHENLDDKLNRLTHSHNRREKLGQIERELYH